MITLDALLFALLIFVLRIINNAIGTLRVVVIARGRRMLSSVLSFFEALLFAVVVANVVNDLSNMLNLLAYCGGYAVGNWLAMVLEARFITSYLVVNVISRSSGHQTAEQLRAAGFGVTETRGEGRDGEVTMLRSVVNGQDLSRAMTIVRESAPDAFVAVEEARTVQQGWLRTAQRIWK